MAWPLIILAAVTVVLGFVENPLKHFLLGSFAAGAIAACAEGAGSHGPIGLALGLAAAGTALAWLEFGRNGAKQIGFVETIPPLYRLFAERWYIDRFYRLLVDLVVDRGISYLCYQNDNKVIDGSIDELCGARSRAAG